MHRGMIAGYFSKDSEERLRNRNLMERYYHNLGYFVMVRDADPDKPITMTKINNDAICHAKSCGYRWLLINDMDSLIPDSQLQESIQMIDMGYDLIIPYDGRFINHFKTEEFEESLDLKDLKEDKPMSNGNSVGSSVMVNLDTIPFENENLKGLMFEDDYRIAVCDKLGLLVGRVPGILYHLDHPRSTNVDRMKTESTQNNLRLYNKLLSMSNKEVEELVANGYKEV